MKMHSKCPDYMSAVTSWRHHVLPIVLFTLIACLFVITLAMMYVGQASAVTRTKAGVPDIIETPCYTVFETPHKLPRVRI